MNAIEVPQHEFWLRDYPDRGENHAFYRIALGELIDAEQRKTYRPPWGLNSPEFGNKSGSMGFMDITARDERIPIAGSLDFPRYEKRRLLVVLVIGIEPDYRGRGYTRLLKSRAEEIALEWGLDTILMDEIDNQIMVEFLARQGYRVYNDAGRRAVKRLNEPNSG